jgi:hypothetical protein
VFGATWLPTFDPDGSDPSVELYGHSASGNLSRDDPTGRRALRRGARRRRGAATPGQLVDAGAPTSAATSAWRSAWLAGRGRIDRFGDLWQRIRRVRRIVP